MPDMFGYGADSDGGREVRIEVNRVSQDNLRKETWEFYVVANYTNNVEVRLDAYGPWVRATTRHKWRRDNKAYHRLIMDRQLGVSRIHFNELPLPGDVLEECKKQIMTRIVFVTEEEKK